VSPVLPMGAEAASQVPTEVEAKLLVPRPADLRDVARMTEIGDYRLRAIRPLRLHTRYLDTADLALARHGVALRVRRDGKRWELTAKWEGSVDGVIHSRPELTIALAGEPPNPFHLNDPALHVALAAIIAGRPLRLVLVSDMLRRRLELLRKDAADDAPVLAEIALDQVHLHGDGEGPTQRYCELEIEQQAGSVADLNAVVALLRERFELLPSAETKFSRGLELLHGYRRSPSSTPTIVPSDTATEAARKIAGLQLAMIRKHDPGTRSGENVESLHDMRVAVRRLRAGLRTMQAGLPEALCVQLRDELRWLGEVLGAVRDLDVQIDRVAAFGASVPAALRGSFAEFHEYLARRRDAQRATMLAELDSRRYGQLLQRLERFAGGRTRVVGVSAGRVPAIAIAADGLTRAYRKLLKQGRAVQGAPLPEELHQLRIRAKRLRYPLEFFGAVAGKPAARAARRLARLQDLLGTYNDSVVAAEFVQGYVDAVETELPKSAMMTLGALIGSEISRGERLRRRFARRWRQFTGKRGKRDIEATIAGLRALAAQPTSCGD